MKIAIVTPRMVIGGAETYVIRKTNWLMRNNHSCIVLSEGGELIQELKCKHYTIKGISRHPYTNNARLRNAIIAQISNILIENDIDIIEVHNNAPMIYVALSYKYTAIPFLVNILSEVGFEKNILSKYICNNLSLDRYSLSEHMGKILEASLKPNRFFKIINIPIESPNYDLSEIIDEGYILAVARLSREKNYILYLLKGFRNAVNQNLITQNIKLVIVGDGKRREFIENEINTYEDEVKSRIFLKGFVLGDELIQLYKKCTVYVGMGTTLLIAASIRKPIINVGFEKDSEKYAWGYWGEIEDDYMTIVGCDVSRKNTFENSLVEILNDKERRLHLSEMSYSLFKKHYSEDTVMKAWIEEYIHVYKKFEYSINIIKTNCYIHILRQLWLLRSCIRTKTR